MILDLLLLEARRQNHRMLDEVISPMGISITPVIMSILKDWQGINGKEKNQQL